MTDTNRRGSITMWAWTISVTAHILLLAVFAVARFSMSTDRSTSAVTPAVTVAQIEKITNQSQIFPKPKVRPLLRNQLAVKRQKTSFAPPAPIMSLEEPHPLPEKLARGGIELLARESTFNSGVEFFGQSTNLRKICYVVDCSGSMQGFFSRVREEIKSSIADLQQDNYFYIIFFHGDSMLESAGGRLIRATVGAKEAAYGFIDEVEPCQTTNALVALERAMRLRGPGGKAPELIYFLTDGLDLDRADTTDFALIVENLRKKLAPATRINTIGFWAQPEDCKILQSVARRSGGRFANID